MNSRTDSVQIIGTAVILVWSLACSGGFATRDRGAADNDRAENGGAGEPISWAVPQAQIPRRAVNLDNLWEEADRAYQAAEQAAAQELFGLVYLVDPTFRGSQIQAALMETCRYVGNDCALVMGRLDLLRIDLEDQLGDRDSWVPQQEADYAKILSCYDLALEGELDAAYGEGYRVMNAPLPIFAQSALQCVDRVTMIRTQQQMASQIRTALEDWYAVFPVFQEAFDELAYAIEIEDWDAIVDVYPGYGVSEETVFQIVESGILANHPELGPDVSFAGAALNEIGGWTEAHYEDYQRMRDAVMSLDSDPGYNQALIEYEGVYAQIPAIRDEIATLEIAAEVTTGDDRRSIDRRIDAKEADIRDIRRDLRRIMARINDYREENGLPVRDEPYGFEL
jgi:hypothetical protein